MNSPRHPGGGHDPERLRQREDLFQSLQLASAGVRAARLDGADQEAAAECAGLR